MSRRKIIVIAVIVVLVALFGWRLSGDSGDAGHGPGGKPGQDNGPVPVTVVPVEQEDVPVYLHAKGTAQARYTVSVRPQVSGRLLSINFQEGTRVEKGEVLAEIDPRTYQAQYDQALARQQQDQAQLATAQSNLERSRDLIKKGYISQQDLTQLENTVNQYKAAVAADRAAARDAKVQLDYTTVRAPFTGLAGIRQVDPGNTISSNDTIVVLTQVHPTNVLFSLPAEHLAQVREGQREGRLSVAAMASADQRVLADDGTVVAIGNRIDPASATFQLKAEFPNQDDALWPGQFVNVRLRVGTVENGLVIPTEAVQRGPDGEFVYVIGADDTARMQAISTAGEADASRTLVASGLAVGDRVVTQGAFRLKPGSKVEPLAPGEVPVAAAASTAAPAAPGH